MDTEKIIIEPLFEKIESYGKTKLELIKLKTINKTTDVAAMSFFSLLLILVFMFFILIFSLGACIYIGNYLGEMYCGFFIVSLFYGILYFLILLFKKRIKRQIKISILEQIYS